MTTTTTTTATATETFNSAGASREAASQAATDRLTGRFAHQVPASLVIGLTQVGLEILATDPTFRVLAETSGDKTHLLESSICLDAYDQALTRVADTTAEVITTILTDPATRADLYTSLGFTTP